MSDHRSSDTSLGKQRDEVVWLRFEGTAERRGSTFKLVARNGNGSIELEEDGVGFTAAGLVFVKKGAVVSHIDEPWHADASARPPPAALGDDCPGGITCCIGSVQVCCHDFRVVGAGAGAWGCARVFQPS